MKMKMNDTDAAPYVEAMERLEAVRWRRPREGHADAWSMAPIKTVRRIPMGSRTKATIVVPRMRQLR